MLDITNELLISQEVFTTTNYENFIKILFNTKHFDRLWLQNIIAGSNKIPLKIGYVNDEFMNLMKLIWYYNVLRNLINVQVKYWGADKLFK